MNPVCSRASHASFPDAAMAYKQQRHHQSGDLCPNPKRTMGIADCRQPGEPAVAINPSASA